ARSMALHRSATISTLLWARACAWTSRPSRNPPASLAFTRFVSATRLATGGAGPRMDVDHDGDLDLGLHFSIADTNLLDWYRQLLLADAGAGGQARHDAATGQPRPYWQDDRRPLFEGLDTVELFLAGNALRDLLQALGIG